MGRDPGGLLMRVLWTRWSLPSSPRGRTDEEHEYYALSEGVYSRFARAYDIFVRPMKSLRRHVVRMSRATTDASVIDAATGTGEQARAFAERCRQVVGVDLSETMLGVARAKTPLPGLTCRFVQVLGARGGSAHTRGFRTRSGASRLKSRSAVKSSITPLAMHNAAIRASWTFAPVTRD